MPTYTAHVDTFALERLPPRSQWPELLFELPELRYPERVNCGVRLLDDAIFEGHGDRPALHSEDGVWSYAHLLATANRIANVLTRELGVVPGNRVLLRGPNNPWLAACWLATMKAGAIAVTTMPMLRARELSVVATRAEVDHAICDVRLLAELQSAARQTGRLRQMLTVGQLAGVHAGADAPGSVDANSPGAQRLEALMGRQPSRFDNVDTASEDICLLAFTSGTTGQPKATVHFHRDVLAMADVVGRHLLRTAPGDLYVGSPPLGFTFGLGALLVFPLAFRASAALIEQPTPERLLAAVQRFGATGLFTAPTLYRQMQSAVTRFDLGSLRQCVSAGEPLPKATSDAWKRATGLRIIDGIGATEMIHIFISAAGGEIRPGATGKPLPGYRACVLDEEGRPLPPGNAGRLAVKGPTGCRYLDDERQRAYVVNGWNVTGDRYFVDEDGYFWFQARADDMILSAGYNIAGPEVESALLEHPAVRECAVVGSPDERRGEVVKAFVVLNAGFVPGAPLVQALQEHVKTMIAPYKYPRAVEFLDALPKTQTGKLQRYVLRRRELERAGRQAMI